LGESPNEPESVMTGICALTVYDTVKTFLANQLWNKIWGCQSMWNRNFG